VSEQEIIDWCRENMAVYKVPRVVQFADSLPKSGSGKVMWRALAMPPASSASSICSSVLPTWLAIFMPELHALIDVRILRLLRIFRIFKLTDYRGRVPGDGRGAAWPAGARSWCSCRPC
jgi:hypothetical protein